MPEAYRVVGVTQHLFANGNFNGPFSELTLTDGARELTVTSSNINAGRIVRETLLEPIYAKSILGQTRAVGTSEFVIGGQNSEAAIRSLKLLNGIALIDIGRALRPRASSAAGFLENDETLIDALLEDNATVLGALVVQNLETNAWVKFSGLLPDFIRAYGFYEGHGTD